MVIVQLKGPFRKRDKFDTPEISEAKHIRDAAATEHKISKLREKAATKRSKSAHQREKAAMFRKKAAKARELSLIYKEEAERLEQQASELEKSLKPIYPEDRGRGRETRREPTRGYGRREERPRGYNTEDEW
jgi:hypothetical protein